MVTDRELLAAVKAISQARSAVHKAAAEKQHAAHMAKEMDVAHQNAVTKLAEAEGHLKQLTEKQSFEMPVSK